MSTKSFYVTGTGRGSAAADATAALAAFAMKNKQSAAVMVPVQTGTSDPMLGALGRIRRGVPDMMDIPALDACCYALESELPACAAAAAEGIEIDFRRISGAWNSIQESYAPDVLFMVNPGKLLEPYSDELHAGTLSAEFELPVILAVQNGLESFSDTMLALNWLNEHEKPVLIVLCDEAGDSAGIGEMLDSMVESPVVRLKTDNTFDSEEKLISIFQER